MDKNKKPFERKYSPYSLELIKALKSSSVLKAVHVDVRNESYWYLSRKKLMAKRQMKHQVVYNKNSQKWESYIYKMEARKSDYEIVPQKVMLKQDHNTKVEALKLCESTCRERDMCPGDNPKLANKVDADKLLNTHFRILVVSPAFERLDSNGRAALVYKELLKTFGTQPIPALTLDRNIAGTPVVVQSKKDVLIENLHTARNCVGNNDEDDDSIDSQVPLPVVEMIKGSLLHTVANSKDHFYARCAPSRMKLGTTFGSNMCNLQLFRYLLPSDSQFPFELIIDSRTPSQWKPGEYPPPLSERFGSSHVDKRASNLPKQAKKQPQVKRIKDISRKVTDRERQMGEFSEPTSPPPAPQEEGYQSTDDGAVGGALPARFDDFIAESLGIDPFISGMKLKKTGGVYGHHFHDIQPNIKEKILNTAIENKKLIKTEGYVKIGAHPVADDDGALTGRTDPSGPFTGRTDRSGIPLTGRSEVDKFPNIHQPRAHLSSLAFDGNDIASGSNGPDGGLSVAEKGFLRSMHSQADSGVASPSSELNNSQAVSLSQTLDCGSLSAVLSTDSRLSKKSRKAKKKGLASVAYAVSADYDKGTHSESEMLMEMYCRARAVEKCAIRLQRIWRIRVFHRAIRWVFRQEYATLMLQRVYRGHYVRNYYFLLRKIAPLAVNRIKRNYRAYVANKLLTRWRKLVYRMTRIVLPWIKLFLKKCYDSWMRKHQHQSTVIQSIARMYICRNRYFKRLGEIYIRDTLIPNAAVQIQRVIRGNWGRARHARLLLDSLFEKIDKPCCLRIQRVYRGCLGRKEAKHKRKQGKAVLLIQRNARIYVHHKWDLIMKYEGLKIHSATLIQKLFRGYLDRDLASRRKKAHWYATVYMPSVILVQATTRMHMALKAYKHLLLQNVAAGKIQFVYRAMLARVARRRRFQEIIRLRRIKNVIIIQSHIRKWLGVMAYKRTLLARAGKRILAGKVIMRAWRNFVYAKRLQILLDESRLKILTDKRGKMVTAREEILEDIQEIKKDIEFTQRSVDRLKIRLKAVDKFIIEANLRIPTLQMELASLSNEDFERGWAEAYGQEYEGLNHMQKMATEERRLIRHYIIRKKREILDLRCELEDSEWEADQIAVLELANVEALRRSEVGRIERRIIDKKNRGLREERCRWKIDSIRMNVITRNRGVTNTLMKEVRNMCVVPIRSIYGYIERTLIGECDFISLHWLLCLILGYSILLVYSRALLVVVIMHKPYHMN